MLVSSLSPSRNSFSFSFFLFVSFILVHSVISKNIIDETCRTCSDKSTAFSYDFCVSSLQHSPVSHVSNLPALAIASMLQALDNATHTVSEIKKLMGTGEFDPFAIACLQDCQELYSESVVNLVDAVRSFLKRQDGTANIRVSAAMEAAETCEEGFGERRGEVSPLSRENYSLFQLGDVALCIINMLSLGLRS